MLTLTPVTVAAKAQQIRADQQLTAVALRLSRISRELLNTTPQVAGRASTEQDWAALVMALIRMDHKETLEVKQDETVTVTAAVEVSTNRQALNFREGPQAGQAL